MDVRYLYASSKSLLELFSSATLNLRWPIRATLETDAHCERSSQNLLNFQKRVFVWHLKLQLLV